MRAILFDLDGTLLDIELSSFLSRYFRSLAAVADGLCPEINLMAEVSRSTDAMMRPHPGLTNREAFFADFLQRTGFDLEQQWERFDRFYAEEFPSLIGDSVPAKGSRRAVETALELGLKVAVATNPIFPMAAVRHRLAWAGLDDLHLPVVTSYEQMHATKPLPAYYRETAALLGVPEADCMMVGDDPVLDLAAADVGMRTFFVGADAGVFTDFRGDLNDLAALLPRLVPRAG